MDHRLKSIISQQSPLVHLELIILTSSREFLPLSFADMGSQELEIQAARSGLFFLRCEKHSERALSKVFTLPQEIPFVSALSFRECKTSPCKGRAFSALVPAFDAAHAK